MKAEKSLVRIQPPPLKFNMSAAMDIEQKYFTKFEKVPGKKEKNNKGELVQYGDELDVTVFERDEFKGETKLGGYHRCYQAIYRTFYPFMQNGKEYAMFSKSSAGIHVMELPSCKEIATQPKGYAGFCPVEFYVPYEPKTGLNGHFGFLAGCVWGDDNGWKIQYLDLSKINEGIVTTDARFSYIKMLDREFGGKVATLKDSIELDYEIDDPDPENHTRKAIIKCEVEFDLITGKQR